MTEKSGVLSTAQPGRDGGFRDPAEYLTFNSTKNNKQKKRTWEKKDPGLCYAQAEMNHNTGSDKWGAVHHARGKPA